jgi:hypothetical protein
MIAFIPNTLVGRYVSRQWDMPELLSREEIVKGDKLKMRIML